MKIESFLFCRGFWIQSVESKKTGKIMKKCVQRAGSSIEGNQKNYRIGLKNKVFSAFFSCFQQRSLDSMRLFDKRTLNTFFSRFINLEK